MKYNIDKIVREAVEADNRYLNGLDVRYALKYPEQTAITIMMFVDTIEIRSLS
jgi:hypothetical protein